MGEPKETSASIAQWQHETFGVAEMTVARLERSARALEVAVDAVRNMNWFTSRPNLSRALRAAEELAELIVMLVDDDANSDAGEEVADVSIVLDGILASHGQELETERAAKMAVNRVRKWKLTGDGHGQHVKDDE